MRVFTRDLTGHTLNFAVRKASGGSGSNYVENRDAFSTCWNLGGPIIESEWIAISSPRGEPDSDWVATMDRIWARGPTPLVAAMRCYVVSKLGDAVEIPDHIGA